MYVIPDNVVLEWERGKKINAAKKIFGKTIAETFSKLMTNIDSHNWRYFAES